MQSKRDEAERRIEEARELRKESLDLGDLGLDELPASLGTLIYLRSLYLGMTGPDDSGEPEWYHERELARFTGLSALSGLSRLQSLNLSYCLNVTDLSVLSGLSGLRILDLSSTGVTDLSVLSGLSCLQSLDMSWTGVTDLSVLSGLSCLQSLNLSYCLVVTDLSVLSGLSSLQSLDLSRTRVRDLSVLSGLSCLQSLDLSWTRVTDLSGLSGLPGLQSLDVFGCRLVEPVSILWDLVEHPRLAELVASKVVGAPREVLSHEEYDDCLPRLRTWFAELQLGAEAENEVKIILLGNGRVGKTQLCRRFRGIEFDSSVESTHGVQIWREALRLETDGSEQTFQVNWWDFGGQDIYHGTHALFLRNRAVFLILWTPGLENREEYDEGGIPMRNQPMAYWLDYVRSLAGAESPVIVVQSQCDGYAERRADPPRPEGFEFFETCAYSARTGRGREILEGHLREAIRYLRERSGALEIGSGRAEVRRRLYALRSADQQRRPEERQNRTLTPADFQILCEEVGGILSWEHALDYFHHTGVVFYQKDLFSDRILLDQDWALEAVYAVFHRGRAIPWLRDSGRFTREDLATLVWQEHSPGEQRLFLGLMKSCGICFACGKTPKGEERYIAPDLLPGYDAVHLPAWDEEAETATLELEYRFFHPAVIRGLMSEIGQQAGDRAEYWKFGLWFKDGKRGAQLRVRFVDTSTEAAPGAGVLWLEAQGREPLGLLREIHRSILWRRVGEPPVERLTLSGATVDRSALANLLDGRVIACDKKLVRPDRFAAFFEGKEHDYRLEIDPQPIVSADKAVPEVFISYSWGDDETPEGKTRTRVVDQLQASLEKAGFQPVRDRDRIKTGERISAFIRQLTRADLVVAVISDKYLRSPYCMYEIYRLWQKAQGDADELVEHVVPIVLPEVRLGSFEDRAPYLEHWSGKAEKLEALIRNPRLRPSSESSKEVRLV